MIDGGTRKAARTWLDNALMERKVMNKEILSHLVSVSFEIWVPTFLSFPFKYPKFGRGVQLKSWGVGEDTQVWQNRG